MLHFSNARMIGAVLFLFLQLVPQFEGQWIVDGDELDVHLIIDSVNRTALCPPDACWVPEFVDNREEANIFGRCVTQLSYAERCDRFDCYFCTTAPTEEGVGWSDGTNCSYGRGTALGRPPQGMVYPGAGGRWFGSQRKLDQLLCDQMDFHPCRCGDTDCLSSFSTTQQRCVNISVPFASQESNDNDIAGTEYCCTVTSSSISLMSALQVTVIAVLSTCATLALS